MAGIYQERGEIGDSKTEHGSKIISREEIQAAIAKAAELRAFHAALMQGNIPSASHFSAHDYPVFTPSYEDEPLTGYQQILLENRNYAETWGEHSIDVGNIDETILSDYTTANSSSRKGLPSDFMNASSRKGLPSDLMMNSKSHIFPAEDQTSIAGSVVKTSSGPDYVKSRRNSLGDIKSVSSYNNCKSAITSNNDSDGMSKNCRNTSNNIVVPLTDSHSSLHSQPKSKGMMSLSWLFPRLKKKNKNESSSPIRSQPEEEVSQMLKDLGKLSEETLKKELTEANERRDAALNEVAGMKSSLGELSQKLEYVETYCEELKKALRQSVEVKNSHHNEKLTNLAKSKENSMSVSEEVMVEGFVQVVTEARQSVKRLCKTLVLQIEENDHTLFDKLNSLLQPYKLSISSKHSKPVLYHLEAIINQSLYQDFENCVFQENGTPKHLDPNQERQARFQLFVALRNLSWNEVLRKGTKYYSDEFSKFCDQKMSGIIAILGWTRPWPEKLLQAFFVAAKCIWLLHLLAFSFNPHLCILRVDENRPFEAHYMEDIFADKQRPQGPSRVKIMVMPGFYVHDQVLRCKVLCRYKSVV